MAKDHTKQRGLARQVFNGLQDHGLPAFQRQHYYLPRMGASCRHCQLDRRIQSVDFFASEQDDRLFTSDVLNFFPDDWNRQSHPLKKSPFGVWEIKLPPVNGKPAIPHSTKVKVSFLAFISIRQ